MTVHGVEAVVGKGEVDAVGLQEAEVLKPQGIGLPPGLLQLLLVEVNPPDPSGVDCLGQPGGDAAGTASQVEEAHPRLEVGEQVLGVAAGAAPGQHFRESLAVPHGVVSLGVFRCPGVSQDLVNRAAEEFLHQFHRHAHHVFCLGHLLPPGLVVVGLGVGMVAICFPLSGFPTWG